MVPMSRIRPALLASFTSLAILLCVACSGCLLLGSPDSCDNCDNCPAQRDGDRDGIFNRRDRDRNDDRNPNDFDFDDSRSPDSGCPDGKCPYGDTETDLGDTNNQSTAASDHAAASLVARHGIGCLGTCRVSIDREAATAPLDRSKLDEVKTGSYCCMRCRQLTVGDSWHNLITDAGDSALFLCKSCWTKTSPTERRGFLNLYLQANGQSETAIGQRFKSSIR